MKTAEAEENRLKNVKRARIKELDTFKALHAITKARMIEEEAEEIIK